MTRDANGNTLSRLAPDGSGALYAYTAHNRLATVTDRAPPDPDTLAATYTYNGLNQRVRKDVDGTVTAYVYGLDGTLLAELDAAGTAQVEYIYLNGQPLAMLVHGTTAEIYAIHNDHLGTPQALTDASGTTVWTATYDPFGRATVDPGSSVAFNLRFSGQYFDQETGLHYNWNRYHDPEIGRYVTSDPIGLDGGLNTYLYVDGNPIMRVDPEGLDSIADMVRDISGMSPNQFSSSRDDLPSTLPLLPNEDMLSIYGDAWKDFAFLTGSVQIGPAIQACGRYALQEQRIQKTVCTLGFLSALCRQEPLDDLMRHLKMLERQRRQAETTQLRTTHAPK